MLPQVPSPNVIVVWGPAGCGKSSIAEGVARQLAFVYIEGDQVRTTMGSNCFWSFQ
jgi:cytidylate kinase